MNVASVKCDANTVVAVTTTVLDLQQRRNVTQWLLVAELQIQFEEEAEQSWCSK